MVIDIHCHVGFSARRVDGSIPRFSFEQDGAAGSPGYDGYLSPRLLKRPAWFFVRRWLGIDQKLGRGEDLDTRIQALNTQHWSGAEGVDRLVLLAFDEYHDDAGRAVGAAGRGQQLGTDLYTSNSLVRAICAKPAHASRDTPQETHAGRPNRFLLGGSIHPYRVQRGRNARDMLEELAAAGVVLIKWLPIHQNIRADDPRTVAFLRKAAELGVPMLIHYGGEMSLSRQHMEFESPVPLLRVLRDLRTEGAMPTVIVAHAATPSFIWQSAAGHRALVDALLGEFADAPLYAEISALGAFGRTPWLRRLARRKELHRKLVWGSDYPVPVMPRSFWRVLDRQTRRRIATLPSWIEQSLRLSQALGYEECVFTQAQRILGMR
ncbi:MAG: amidohydrolase family protein [Phycisphaerae bacterium]|nr:amidohydrolase family protein [Phycisphaerae bacterium]